MTKVNATSASVDIKTKKVDGAKKSESRKVETDSSYKGDSFEHSSSADSANKPSQTTAAGSKKLLQKTSKLN